MRFLIETVLDWNQSNDVIYCLSHMPDPVVLSVRVSHLDLDLTWDVEVDGINPS